MITTLNGINADIQARYLKLFNEASDALIEANALKPTYSPAPNFDPDSFVSGTYYFKDGESYVLANTWAEAEGKELYIQTSSITTLEEYFCQLKTLYDLQINNKFLMLPLSEEFFEINANTRTITVPKAFAKGIGVAGDVIAETLLFRVDRFFDITDLYTTDIYVQWEGADKKQYVSLIDMVDAETYADEGKIVFGWPLTDKLAATAGTIKFAVRFIKTDPAIKDKIVYSLGTLSTTATINPTLTFNIFEAAQDDGAHDLFNDAIENSENTTGPQAKAPVFVNDLPALANMRVDASGNASVEIRVSTSVADLGNVTYKWYHKADADSRRVFLASDGGQVDTTVPSNFRVSSVYEKTADTSYNTSKVYYVLSGDGVAYVRNTNANASVSTLYERYSVLSISGNEANILPDGSSPVTGYYYVEATNRLSSREKTTKSSSTSVPMPELPVIKENGNLPGAVTLDEGTARLEFGVTVTEPAVKAHNWSYSIDQEDWEVLDEENKSILNASTVGYYKAGANATLNLGRTFVESNVCKVVDLPVAPSFVVEDAEGAQEQAINLKTEVEIIPQLESVPSGDLYTDAIYYYWEADASEEGATASKWEAITGNFETARLDLTEYGYDGGAFRCVAVNMLNGKTAEARSKLYVMY